LDYLFGPNNSSVSQAEYPRLLHEWEAGNYQLPGQSIAIDPTINELVPSFWPHVENARIDGSWLTPQERHKLVKKGRKAEWSRGVVNQRIGCNSAWSFKLHDALRSAGTRCPLRSC